MAVAVESVLEDTDNGLLEGDDLRLELILDNCCSRQYRTSNILDGPHTITYCESVAHSSIALIIHSLDHRHVPLKNISHIVPSSIP